MKIQKNFIFVYRIPRQLIVGANYKRLSVEAKLLYGLLLDWMEAIRFGHSPSKYGLLTAKFHLLGAAAPKTLTLITGLKLRRVNSTNKINIVGKKVSGGVSPLGGE